MKYIFYCWECKKYIKRKDINIFSTYSYQLPSGWMTERILGATCKICNVVIEVKVFEKKSRDIQNRLELDYE